MNNTQEVVRWDNIRKQKKVALSYFDALEKAEPEQVLQVFREYMTEDYNWKGVYPFREQNGRELWRSHSGYL